MFISKFNKIYFLVSILVVCSIFFSMNTNACYGNYNKHKKAFKSPAKLSKTTQKPVLTTDKINISEENNGQNVYLKVGQKLNLNLVSNESTGFSWSYTNVFDKNILKETNHAYIASTTGLDGAPAEEVWTYEAVNEGKTSIALNYSRSGDYTSAINTYSINIIVSE